MAALVGSIWSHHPHSQKAESDQKVEEGYKTSNVTLVASSRETFPSKDSTTSPKEHHPLETKCSNTWASVVHSTLKVQHLTRVCSSRHLWVPVVQIAHEAATMSARAAVTSQALAKGEPAWVVIHMVAVTLSSLSLPHRFHYMLAFTMAASFP